MCRDSTGDAGADADDEDSEDWSWTGWINYTKKDDWKGPDQGKGDDKDPSGAGGGVCA